jgi:hypothetical protein
MDQRLFMPTLCPLTVIRIHKPIKSWIPTLVTLIPLTFFTSMIDLKPGDMLTVDLPNHTVETIERGGLCVYRRAWLN